MHEYSPKRRTALVFTGSGTSGAYHAGVLRALDESGVKIDLVVGSGVGAIAAAYAAVDGGAKLYGPGGFWDRVRWRSLFRLRPAAVAGPGSAPRHRSSSSSCPSCSPSSPGCSFRSSSSPTAWRRAARRALLGRLWIAPESLSGPYLAALAMPVFVLALLAMVAR